MMRSSNQLHGRDAWRLRTRLYLRNLSRLRKTRQKLPRERTPKPVGGFFFVSEFNVVIHESDVRHAFRPVIRVQVGLTPSDS